MLFAGVRIGWRSMLKCRRDRKTTNHVLVRLICYLKIWTEILMPSESDAYDKRSLYNYHYSYVMPDERFIGFLINIFSLGVLTVGYPAARKRSRIHCLRMIKNLRLYIKRKYSSLRYYYERFLHPYSIAFERRNDGIKFANCL